MFNWHFLSIVKCLDVIRIFVFGWDFPAGGAKFWVFWAKWPPKRQIREKHLLEGHFLTPNCVFWAIVSEIISICLACAGSQEKKVVRQEEKSHKAYISRGAIPSGRIITKLGKCVYLTDVIKLAKFHGYNLRGFGAVSGKSFHVAIGNQGRP